MHAYVFMCVFLIISLNNCLYDHYTSDINYFQFALKTYSDKWKYYFRWKQLGVDTKSSHVWLLKIYFYKFFLTHTIMQKWSPERGGGGLLQAHTWRRVVNPSLTLLCNTSSREDIPAVVLIKLITLIADHAFPSW